MHKTKRAEPKPRPQKCWSALKRNCYFAMSMLVNLSVPPSTVPVTLT